MPKRHNECFLYETTFNLSFRLFCNNTEVSLIDTSSKKSMNTIVDLKNNIQFGTKLSTGIFWSECNAIFGEILRLYIEI